MACNVAFRWLLTLRRTTSRFQVFHGGGNRPDRFLDRFPVCPTAEVTWATLGKSQSIEDTRPSLRKPTRKTTSRLMPPWWKTVGMDWAIYTQTNITRRERRLRCVLTGLPDRSPCVQRIKVKKDSFVIYIADRKALTSI